MTATRRTRTARFIATTAGALSVLGIGFGLTPSGTPVAHAASSCAGVELGNLSDAQISVLFGAGWTGDPTDGREELYPVGCVPPVPGAALRVSCDAYGGGMVIANLRPDQLHSLADAGWVGYLLHDGTVAAYAPGCTPTA